MAYTALYRRFRPKYFKEVVRTRPYNTNTKESNKSRKNRTCIFTYRRKRNRKNLNCKNICKSNKLFKFKRSENHAENAKFAKR